MAKEYVIGVDIGTSSCKLAAFTLQGELAYQGAFSYATRHPKPGWAEQQAEDWWQAVCLCLKQMFAKEVISKEQIVGIGIAGQSWAVLPVDRKGEPLRPAMIWLDRRAERECQQIKERIAEEQLFEHSGNPIDSSYSTAKMIWYKEHQTALYQQTHQFLSSNGYIVYRLTGEVSHDLSQGYGFHAFDMDRGRWDAWFCKQLGIDPALLPPLVESSQVIGQVTVEAARQTGLAVGTPVVAGGLDAACGTLGVGVIQTGETQEQGGQAGGMSIVVDRPIKSKSLILGYHVLPQKWLLQGGTVGGGSFQWLGKQLALYGIQTTPPVTEGATSSLSSLFQWMNKQAEQIKPGSGGLLFLPYMAGERSPIWDAEAKGAFLGLSYEKKAGHLIRAIMEGCAYALHHNLDVAAKAGVVVSELYSMGGAANSRLWTQIKADVTGKRISIPWSDEATTWGAAILAGMGTGVYRDAQEAVQPISKIKREHLPNQEHAQIYQRSYSLYLEAYQHLRPFFPKLS